MLNSILYGSAYALLTAPIQPITQASLDPSCDDIRDLQAEQELCGAMGCFGLITLKIHGKPVFWAANPLSVGSVPLFSDQRKASTKTAGSIGFKLD